jgi:DNA-binding transcriptional MerR regulator
MDNHMDRAKEAQRMLTSFNQDSSYFNTYLSSSNNQRVNITPSGFTKKDPHEINFIKLAGEHLGLPEEEIKKILNSPNDESVLETCFKEYYAELLPIAANIIDLTSAELQKHITGLKFSNRTEINATSLKCKDGKYSIVVNPPIAMYCWKICKLYATLFGKENKNNFKHTAKLVW